MLVELSPSRPIGRARVSINAWRNNRAPSRGSQSRPKPRPLSDLTSYVSSARGSANTRLLRELSQEALAERAGCSAGGVSRIERGQSDAGITTAYGLAQALGVGVEKLLPELDGGPAAPRAPSESEWERISGATTHLHRSAEEMIRFADGLRRPVQRVKRG